MYREYLFKLHRDTHIVTCYEFCKSKEEALGMVEELKNRYVGVMRVEVFVKHIEWRTVD